ncbi:pyridoxal-phosphate dependent enzyme [Yoonia sp. R2331]|uniref:pyridoxal-phosphate dependent enzyme n=1 Tax=Yoonia sp. R2331 TaxID=3237238 RepID=UPI0034E4E5B9
MSGVPQPSTDAATVATRLAHCPTHAETPLVKVAGLADVATLWVKDERGRMGLGSFKALGAAYVIARDAEDGAAKGRTYVTASAGNHGMSVAAGARVFAANSVVYIAQTVPEVFAKRLQAEGARVVLAGANYAESMAAAAAAADQNGWTLLSDSSWAGYTTIPHRLMEGYVQMAAEAVAQVDAIPTHIFLQAGVGGLAGAVAAYARKIWGDAPRIVVVEPEAAPALMESARAGRAVVTSGPDSNMGRLDCKEPSLIALNGLARDADDFVTISDAAAEASMPVLAQAGLATTPSGGAGIVAVMEAGAALGLSPDARVLCILSEEPAR